MNPAIRQIIGRTIDAVIISEANQQGAGDQIFLVFTDGTYYEIYGNLHGVGGVDQGGFEAALRYAERGQGNITIHKTNSDE